MLLVFRIGAIGGNDVLAMGCKKSENLDLIKRQANLMLTWVNDTFRIFGPIKRDFLWHLHESEEDQVLVNWTTVSPVTQL